MNRVLEIILVALIFGTTLAFGGVQPLTTSIMEVVVLGALLVLLIKQTREGRIHLPLPVWPVLFIVWIALQVIPLPSRLVLLVSPSRWVAFDAAGSTAIPAWTTLSIYPHDTISAAIRLLAYLGAFLLAAHVFETGRGKSRLPGALIFIGVFEAAYGIVQYLTGWHKIFTYTKQFDLHEATGTYINRNHFAGLLEMTIPFVVASIFYFFQRWLQARRNAREVGALTSGFAFRPVFYGLLLVIMAVGVVFSRSRTGILAMIFSVIAVALLAQIKVRQKTWMLVVFVFLMAVVGYGLWIGLGPVLSRFEKLGEEDYLEITGRVSIWANTLEVVQDYPLTGTGLGTFPYAFRRYQTVHVDRFVDHAHNDYLEFAAETGLPGVLVLLLPVVYLLFRMISSFLDDPRRHRRAITLGCIGSTLALLLHSVTDFNLQIPANALIFAVILGMGYKATCVERRREAKVAATLNSPPSPPSSISSFPVNH